MKPEAKFGAGGFFRRAGAVPVVGFCLVLAVAPAAGMDWKTETGLTLRGTYTDNVDLVEAGRKKVDDLSLRVQPSLSVEGEGGRVNLNFNYAPSVIYHASGDQGRSFTHSLGSGLQSRLYKNILFFDATASAGLSPIDLGGKSGSDSLNDTGNFVQTFSYSLTPHIKGRVKNYANLAGSYTYDEVINAGSQPNSLSHSLQGTLSSGSFFTHVPWSVGGRYSHVDEASTKDSELGNVAGSLGYILNRKWRLNGSLGWEYNDILSRRPTTDGITWDVGATWTPNRRTSLDLSYGERFFGNNFGLSFSHESRRTRWTASYGKSLASWRMGQLIGRQVTYGEYLDWLLEVLSGTGISAGLRPGVSRDDTAFTVSDLRLSTEYFVAETFATDFSLKTGRSNLDIGFYYSEHHYEVIRDWGWSYTITTRWDRKLTPKTSTNVGLSWEEFRHSRSEPMSSRWTAKVGLSRKLSADTSADLSYQYRTRDSRDPTMEYDENRIGVTLRTRW